MEQWIDWLTEPEAWIALLSLTALEIVLGVDNIIFISILVGRLPAEQRARARIIGLGLAMVMRIALLLSLAWMMRLTEPLFSITRWEFSGRDLILLVRRALPAREIGARDPQRAGGRRRGRPWGAESRPFHRHARPDRHHRHRVLARFGDHGGRHGRRDPGDGARDRLRRRHHDVRREADRRFRRHASDDQDAGVVVPDPDRRRAGRRRLRAAHSRRATSTSRWPSPSPWKC